MGEEPTEHDKDVKGVRGEPTDQIRCWYEDQYSKQFNRIGTDPPEDMTLLILPTHTATGLVDGVESIARHIDVEASSLSISCGNMLLYVLLEKARLNIGSLETRNINGILQWKYDWNSWKDIPTPSPDFTSCIQPIRTKDKAPSPPLNSYPCLEERRQSSWFILTWHLRCHGSHSRLVRSNTRGNQAEWYGAAGSIEPN